MRKFYVETLRPCYPEKGVKYVVHAEKEFSRDCLSPGMTAVFEVSYVKTKQEAIACVIEHAAGFPTCVRLLFGGRKKETA